MSARGVGGDACLYAGVVGHGEGIENGLTLERWRNEAGDWTELRLC